MAHPLGTELQAMLPSIPDLMEDLVAVEALLDGR